MNIFISWSGDLSKQIGEVFNDWMPTVIQNIKPYFTPSDIEKGSKWESEISKKLSECSTGIIILTKDNLKSQWIMFEAGALSNKLDKSRVCPILIGVDNPDLTGPLSTFQTTKFNKNDIRQLMLNVNGQCGDNKLSEKVFDEVFNVFWPRLEEKIEKILIKQGKTTNNIDSSIKRPDREILEEILELSRMNSRRNIVSYQDKNKREYLEISEKKKTKLEVYIGDYLKSTNTRLKEFSLVDPEEVCQALEHNNEVRDLAGGRKNLLNVIVDYLEQNE